METSDFNNVTMAQIHNLVGGMGNSTKDFIVCKDFRWDGHLTGNAYRAETAAVILCRKGSMKLRVNLNERNMREGSLMLYGPNSVVSMLERSDDVICDMIFFSPKFMHESRIDLDMIMPIYNYVAEDSNDLLQLEPDESDLVQNYYTLMRDCMQFDKPQIIRGLMEVMFRVMSELYSRRVSETGNVSKTRQQEYFERFVKQVAVCYREQRSVKFYADALYITPKYLSTVIKEISGKSAAEWINEFVIQEAKMMLGYSTKSIQEITYYLNFSTQSFFGKYFKRYAGMSPSEFRANKNKM